MNILILGSGGREHAFTWKIAQSSKTDNLFIAPGNAGTASLGTNVALDILDFDALAKFSLTENIEMIVVGPEAPLVNGIYDFFKSEDTLKHINIIGPSKQGATLEGSKTFAKEFMLKYDIPTAGYNEFDENNLEEGLVFIDNNKPPFVLKADGLAGGKGVIITSDKEEAKTELKAMISESKFGYASSKVIIEEFLDGIEFSVFVLSDGENYQILPIAKDYKRIGEGDKGLNTGGMGAVSPVPFVSEELMETVKEKVIIPTIEGMKKENIVYKGFYYIGLILVNGEAKVIEYNCRMGDPETQVVLPLIESDLVELFTHCGNGTLDQIKIKNSTKTAVTVVIAANGYPESYKKGIELSNLKNSTDTIVFHAGTKLAGDKILSNGGRVLTVTSFGTGIKDTVNKSLKVCESIVFEGKYYRKDIGYEFID